MPVREGQQVHVLDDKALRFEEGAHGGVARAPREEGCLAEYSPGLDDAARRAADDRLQLSLDEEKDVVVVLVLPQQCLARAEVDAREHVREREQGLGWY